MVPEANLSAIIDVNLADHGGSTMTHALYLLGPAVDAIAGVDCLLSTDQTGKSRPIDGDSDGNADCDIGAYENNEFVDVIFEDGFDM